MNRRGHTRWRIDWRGEGAPQVGHLVRYVTPTNQVSFARVTSVRVVRNRLPLPSGVGCRYAITVQRFDEKPAGEPVSWTCYAHSKPKRLPPQDANPWLPPLTDLPAAPASEEHPCTVDPSASR